MTRRGRETKSHQPWWFPYFPKDFESDPNVATMSGDAACVYSRLLGLAWMSKAVLPKEPEKIRRLLRLEADHFARVWPEIAEVWPVSEDAGGRVNARLSREFERAVARSESASRSALAGKKGKASAQRTHSDRSTKAVRPQSERASTKTETDTQTETEKGIKTTPAPSGRALLDLWNEESGNLRKAKDLSGGRARHAKTRLTEEPDLAVWRVAIRTVAKSAFCNGAGEKGWTASFDWLLRPDSLTKILEGAYDEKPNGKPPATAAHAHAPDWAKASAEILAIRNKVQARTASDEEVAQLLAWQKGKP